MKSSSYLPLRNDYAPASVFHRARICLPWTSVPAIIPHRFRRRLWSKLRSRQSPASAISDIEWSISPADTLRSLRAHKWSFYDAHYLILIVLAVFCLSVIETPGALVKTGVATFLITTLLIPVTRQFFLPFLPIASWLVLFYAAGSVHLSSCLFNRVRVLVADTFDEADFNQIRPRCVPPANLGSSLARSREHLLRRKPQ